MLVSVREKVIFMAVMCGVIATQKNRESESFILPSYSPTKLIRIPC